MATKKKSTKKTKSSVPKPSSKVNLKTPPKSKTKTKPAKVTKVALTIDSEEEKIEVTHKVAETKKASEVEPQEDSLPVTSWEEDDTETGKVADSTDIDIDDETETQKPDAKNADKWHEIDHPGEAKPVLGDNQWEQSSSEDEEEIERPEWDEEKWQQANIEEEEIERPEWDEEKWRQSQETVEAESAQEDIDSPAELDKSTSAENLDGGIESKTEEFKVSEQTKDTDEEVPDEVIEPADESILKNTDAEKTIVSKGQVEELDIDARSASAVALNVDDPHDNKPKLNLKSRPQRLVAWWKKAKLKHSLVTAVMILLLLIVAVPAPRYSALNTVGVRASASITILDSETKLPLKKVDVVFGGATKTTNDNGLVIFDKVKLGSQQIKVIKSAYDSYTENVTISIGDNKVEPIYLISIGKSFDFKISDWLSEGVINGAEVSYATNSSYSDGLGVAKLNIPAITESMITIVVSAPNYLTKEVEIDTTINDQILVKLVPDKAHYFVSKRSGSYDIYKINVDGSNEALILAGNGNEKEDIRFDVSPSGNKSILVATRDLSITNSEGFIMSGLYIINNVSSDLTKVDSSERIDIVGWIGETVIYVKVQAGASGQNPNRHRLMSYNTSTGEQIEIAASNYFNDVLVAKDYVFYAPSDAYKLDPKPYLFRSNADATNIDTVFEKNVWTILRKDYDNIYFDSDQVWYNGSIDRVFNKQLDTKPINYRSRLYSTNPSSDKAVWVDQRDGKGTLILTDIATGTDSVIIARGGLRNPIVWINNNQLIFRVVTSDETADYIISLDEGSKPLKIGDVTNISGADRWYYYY